MGSDFGRPSNTLTALFQSTLPGWGATDLVLRVGQFEPISIHAPRMGSDSATRLGSTSRQNFNPRSPDGERRAPPRSPVPSPGHFNPRSPDGERLCGDVSGVPVFSISIHAPRMGSDPVKSRSQQNLEAFQSTLPGWGATLRGVVPYLTCYTFQSTLPGWGATLRGVVPYLTCYTFQSTLPGWGATIESTGNATDVMIFQSTLPGWGATHNSSLGMVANSQFQSTLPGWGATEARHPTRSPVRYFNPRSPDGERRFARECRSQTFLFQSTLPGWGATGRCRHGSG